jgi:BirA family transcriptional regulator, biotin operon repressor / biotin---[acetyl-CoA-carboxylase] ligase
MRSPLEAGPLLEVDEAPSTQDVLAEKIRAGGAVPGAVLALHQVSGRGRFGRCWISAPDQALTVSFAFPMYADHPRPYLVGMAVAAAAAGVLHCRLRWPNDLLLAGKKLGGILTELVPDERGRRVPVVGVGINLGQESFPPELEEIATSLKRERGANPGPRETAEAIAARIELMPEPHSWSDLAPVWALFDETPGKRYRLQSGETAIGLGIGPEGELLCSIDGESGTVLAADAIFGKDP